MWVLILTINYLTHRFSRRESYRLAVSGFSAVITSTVWIGSYIILVEGDCFWHHACFRSLFEHVIAASLMSKRTQISHLRAIFSCRSILTKCWCSLRVFICSPVHHIVSNLFHLLIDLFVILLCLLLESRLFNQWLVLVHTSTNLVRFNHQFFLLLLNFYSKRAQRPTTFQRRLVVISDSRRHTLPVSFSRVYGSWIRRWCLPWGSKLTGSPSSSRLVSTMFLNWRYHSWSNISWSILFKTKYPHKLLKVQFYVTLLLLCVHFKVFKSHDIISTRPLPRGVTQKHLILVCINEVGKNFVSQPTLLLNTYIISFTYLNRPGLSIRACSISLGATLLSALLKYFYLICMRNLFFLFLGLFLLLLGIVLYLIHLLLDLIHTKTLLQRVGLSSKCIQFLLKLDNVVFGVSLLKGVN